MVQCNASAGDREGGWAEWFCCFEWMGKKKRKHFRTAYIVAVSLNIQVTIKNTFLLHFIYRLSAA